MPKVSIIIPNYNYAPYLERRVQSVLNQTYQDFEIIYLDDASTDDSKEVFKKFSGKKRIREFSNKINSGSPFKQWNKGAKEARGKYLWIAEADDYADSRLLDRLVDILENYPKLGLAYCQSWSVDENDNILSSWEEWTQQLDEKRWQKDFINNGQDEIQKYLIFKNTIPNASAVLMRRSIFECVGGAEETFKLCGDFMLWIKMLLVSDIAFIAEPLNFFRSHDNTVRSRIMGNYQNIEEMYRIRLYIFNHLCVPKQSKEKICSTLAWLWFNCMIDQRNKYSFKKHFEVFRIAARTDSKIYKRLFKALIGNFV